MNPLNPVKIADRIENEMKTSYLTLKVEHDKNISPDQLHRLVGLLLGAGNFAAQERYWLDNLEWSVAETKVAAGLVVRVVDGIPLRDTGGAERVVTAKVEPMADGSLWLNFDGYGDAGSAPGCGSPLGVELHENELRVLLFPDITSEDVQIVSIEGARVTPAMAAGS